MTDWQDIATAPKDGSTVLLWVPGIRQPVQIGHWIDQQTIEYGKVVRSRAEWAYSFGSLIGEAPAPSHWTAMPAAPSVECLSVDQKIARAVGAQQRNVLDAVRRALPGMAMQTAFERG